MCIRKLGVEWFYLAKAGPKANDFAKDIFELLTHLLHLLRAWIICLKKEWIWRVGVGLLDDRDFLFLASVRFDVRKGVFMCILGVLS